MMPFIVILLIASGVYMIAMTVLAIGILFDDLDTELTPLLMVPMFILALVGLFSTLSNLDTLLQ